MATPPIAPFRPTLIRRVFVAIGWCLLGCVLTAATAWAAMTVCFANLTGAPPRYVLAALFFAAAAGVLLFVRPRRYSFGAWGIMFAVIFIWFFSLTPSNNRDWAVGVAMLPSAEIRDNIVTIHNVRNFDYRSEKDFDTSWETRTYDLDQLVTADFILVYWGSKAIGHVIMSFGFQDGRHLAVSIEARREKSESYSAIEGFFRQYELIYVVADERDVLRLRTNYSNEHVYLYRLRVAPENIRPSLVSYIERMNSLAQQPEWYNALTTNCATSVLDHVKAGGGKGKLSLDILLSGYAARQAYRNGKLDDSMAFEELERRSLINPAANAADKDLDFSARIRVGLPEPQLRSPNR